MDDLVQDIMIPILHILLALAPVLVFLLVLVLLDSYRLVSLSSILTAIAAGASAALVCYTVTVVMRVNVPDSLYRKCHAPILEEILKAGVILFLFQKKRIGFLVDSAIFGFAVGTGFAVIENIDYLLHLRHAEHLIWMIRGFGTAVMHGSTTGIFAMISLILLERKKRAKWAAYLPGLAAAILVHMVFNLVFLSALVITLMQILLLPFLVMGIFSRSEKALKGWLETGLDTDVLLMEYILSGQIRETPVGRYLKTLKQQFPGEVVADMLCYLRIYLELAIRAKGILLMQGAGFQIKPDEEIRCKFEELKYLEKSIGRMGRAALHPVLKFSNRDLWQIFFLQKRQSVTRRANG